MESPISQDREDGFRGVRQNGGGLSDDVDAAGCYKRLSQSLRWGDL